MIAVDVNAHIGAYPWRSIPHPEPAVLARVLEREGIASAWVGHLPSAFWRDPTSGNAELYAALAHACTECGRALVLSVRFEDSRQRHPLDLAPDLTPAHVRALARETRAALVVVNAGREFIEEVAWGLTPDERARVWFDFSWVWGPPEDHFATLLRTLGPDRFVYGTGWPLRLTQNARANVDLLARDARALLDRAPLATGADVLAIARVNTRARSEQRPGLGPLGEMEQMRTP